MSELSRAERAKRALYALETIAGLPHREIAARLSVSVATVGSWTAGQRIPLHATLGRIEALLDDVTTAPDPEVGRLRAVVSRLHVLYGSPDLNNKADPLDELFFILLSLKTSHRAYEDTYRRFRKRFYPWRKLISASPEEVESYIRSGGLGSIRARAFVEIARRLKQDFGRVSLASLKGKPNDEVKEYLKSLPGVGIKTARCVAMYALHRDVTPVDTHTYRVGVRIGLVPTSRSANEAHKHFDELVPPKLAYPLHTNFVAHGREICTDPVPRCERCPLQGLCDFFARTGSRSGTPTGNEPARQARTETPPAPPAAGGELDRQLVAADMYAGCGGLSLGLRSAGIRVAYAVDWDKYACETHRANAPEVQIECKDIHLVTGAEIEQAAGGHVDLLAGGPNCQGLSQLGLRSPDDPRNFMLQEFARLVSELRPRMFLFENVPGLVHRHNFPVVQGIFGWFRELGYECAADVLLAADYGVPQLRHRFFMIGTCDPSIDLTLPPPTHGPGRTPYVTVRDAIGDLPALAAVQRENGKVSYRAPASGEFQRYGRGRRRKVENHVAPQTSAINLERIRHIPEGGNWKDIPAELLPPRLVKSRMTDHSTTYGRLRWNQPSFTITALLANVTAGAFTHPSEHRAITIREGARLQSFPDAFVFRGPRNSQAKQIGNAVPPLLARAVGEHIRELLLGHRPAGILPRITAELLSDRRAWDALPVLTPRFKPLFGQGTKWPVGWGPEPEDHTAVLDTAWKLRPEFRSLDARGG